MFRIIGKFQAYKAY